MSSVVSDTHALLWDLTDPDTLSAAAVAAMDDSARADSIFVPSICVVELTYLVERYRVPAQALQTVRDALQAADTAFELTPLDAAVADAVARIPRDVVPDMPDRIIAATALVLGLPLVTRDAKIRSTQIPTIW